MTAPKDAETRPREGRTSGDNVSSAPLAEAKLSAPRVKVDAVPRPRILEVLQRGGEAALTLVAAPPGYGKTTSVRSWCAGHGSPVAWVTLDSGDNDAGRLWTYVATAVDRVRNGLGRQAMLRLSVAGSPIENAVDELMNGLAAFGDELVVVIDDLQEVTDTDCLASLEYAVSRLPPSVRLILITRTDPPLGLAALRAREALVELRAAELAFTADEALELLVARGGVDLGSEELELLLRRTEGWPAALVLAGVWLRAVDDARAAVTEFSGDHRFVVEYLSRVAFEALGEDVRAFLIRASVLGRLTPELCDEVLGRSDSAAVLAELERSSLLIVRLERGGWYRIHALLAEFGRFQLAALEPGAETEIHRRALDWFRERGLIVEAMEHAFLAGEHESAAQMLVENHHALFRSGRMRTLLRLVRAMPDEVVARHLELAISGALATTMIGGGALERRRYLTMVRRVASESPERVSPYVAGIAAMLRALTLEGGVSQAVPEGRKAVEAARSGVDDLSVSARAGLAYALFFAGELDEPWALALEAVELPEVEHRPPGHALARVVLALVATARGQRDTARLHAETARTIIGGIGSSRSWLGAQAAAALGVVNADEGNLSEAEPQLAQAEHFFRDEVAAVQHTWLLLLLARVRCRRGRLEEAEKTMRSALSTFAELGDVGRVAGLAIDVEEELEHAKSRAADGEVLALPTKAELAVLSLLATDLSVREIGEKLFLSPNTVRSHTRALHRKLGVSSRADAVARAAALGLLGEGESATGESVEDRP
jgi:LuxR family transcriptional regulator, maltose regulon positive regulatory protein